MSCTGCQGAVTVESYVDAEENGYGLRWVSAWHCVSCGLVPESMQAGDSPEAPRRRMVPARPKRFRGAPRYAIPAQIPA
jgi:hypothetical protein